MGYEVTTATPDEYAFVLDHLGRVTVLVGRCATSLYLDRPMAGFVDVALDIGRTLGCGPYADDHEPTEPPPHWRGFCWTAFRE